MMELFRFEAEDTKGEGHICFDSQLSISALVIDRVTDNGDLTRLFLYHFSLKVEAQTGHNAPTKRNKLRKIFG